MHVQAEVIWYAYMHMGKVLSTKMKGLPTILLAFLINTPRGEDLGAS
jgi:hypothetical protein